MLLSATFMLCLLSSALETEGRNEDQQHRTLHSRESPRYHYGDYRLNPDGHQYLASNNKLEKRSLQNVVNLHNNAQSKRSRGSNQDSPGPDLASLDDIPFSPEQIGNAEVTLEGCGYKIHAADDGHIVSPNYPHIYPAGLNCTWYLYGFHRVDFHSSDISLRNGTELPGCDLGEPKEGPRVNDDLEIPQMNFIVLSIIACQLSQFKARAFRMQPSIDVMPVYVIVVMSLMLRSVTSLDQTLKDHILKVHNDYRAKQGASNMPKLEWDSTLESGAQEWADKCVFKHKGMGENLAWNSAVTDPEEKLIDTAMENFYNEYKRYSYGTTACGNYNACHYTQIVWAKTTKVGCATKMCDGLANAYNKKTWFLVCRFDPVGNWGGKKPYEKGTACSACQGATCEGGLCVGGTVGSAADAGGTVGSAADAGGTVGSAADAVCEDKNENCADWADFDQCDINPGYMHTYCKKSCNTC